LDYILLHQMTYRYFVHRLITYFARSWSAPCCRQLFICHV